MLKAINNMVWGTPTLILILGTGLYFSLRTGFAQLRLLPSSIKKLLKNLQKKGDHSSVKALCTALAATVGTGNVAGVAGAIAIGGPGSIFWMWVCAIIGMITKYAEALLAAKFSMKNSQGELCGGPMFVMERGLGRKWRPMAVCYSVLGVFAAFGVGNATQVNTVVSSFNAAMPLFGGKETDIGNLLVGLVLTIMFAAVFLGGARKVGNVAELLIPVAAGAYVVLCIGALIYHAESIPQAFSQIVVGAFKPQAVTGGVIGSCLLTLKVGTARGVFTNEAGMGTAGIAHGTADVANPAEQGLMGIMEVFLDTIVICTLTALVILASGISIPYGLDEGAVLTTQALSETYGAGVSIPILLLLAVFAFATLLGWGFYGLQCFRYLFGEKFDNLFLWMMVSVTIAGSLMKTGDVWMASELINGLMAIPNLITLVLLRRSVTSLTADFIQEEHRTRASGKNLPEGSR